MAFDEQEAVGSFWIARARGEFFPAEWFDRLTLDDAYRIQLDIVARRCGAGERQIGWKVGLTAGDPATIRFPRTGVRLHPGQQAIRARVPPRRTDPPWVRARTVSPGQPAVERRVSMATARAAIDMVYPALEIIETRGDFTAQIALAMADNAQQKTIILGDPVPLAGMALEPSPRPSRSTAMSSQPEAATRYWATR